MIDPHLIQEKRLADISDIGLFPSEIIYQIGVVEINFLHLTQPANPARIIPKLGYQSSFLDIKTIVCHTVAAHIEGRGYTAYVRFERNAFSDNGQELLQFPASRNIHTGILGDIRFEGEVHDLLDAEGQIIA